MSETKAPHTIGFYGDGEVKKRAALRLLDDKLRGLVEDETPLVFSFVADANWTDTLDVIYDYALDVSAKLEIHAVTGTDPKSEAGKLVTDVETEGGSVVLMDDEEAARKSMLAGVDTLIVLYTEENDVTHEVTESAIESGIATYDMTYGMRPLELTDEAPPEEVTPGELLLTETRRLIEEDGADVAADWLADQDRDMVKEMATEWQVEFADRARTKTIAGDVVNAILAGDAPEEAEPPTEEDNAPEELAEPAAEAEMSDEETARWEEAAIADGAVAVTTTEEASSAQIVVPSLRLRPPLPLSITVEMGALIIALDAYEGDPIDKAFEVIERLRSLD